MRGPYIFSTSARSWTLSSVNIHSVFFKKIISLPRVSVNYKYKNLILNFLKHVLVENNYLFVLFKYLFAIVEKCLDFIKIVCNKSITQLQSCGLDFTIL